VTDNNDNIHRLVEDRYAAFAVASDAGLSACEPGSETWGKTHYDDLGELPDGAVLASLGCGTRLPSRIFALTTACSISARAAALMSCCQPNGSDQPAMCTAST
jgi:hypothetical protein